MTFEETIQKARNEAFQADYLSETLSYPGLRAVYAEKSAMLHRLVYLAEIGLNAINDKKAEEEQK